MPPTTGLDIVRRVLERLRQPAETSLPHKTILRTVQGVIARKKVDLLLSPQNHMAATSEWFTPTARDIQLDEIGLTDILLPVGLERRDVGSELEVGTDVPIVSYEVLNTSTVGGASYYGSPLRLVFRDTAEYVAGQEFRLIYEPDFYDEELGVDSPVALPVYFASMVEIESAYELLELIQDDSPEWLRFVDAVNKKWVVLITDWREQWNKYTKLSRGRVQVPKRTFWQNKSRQNRVRYFKG